MNRINVKLPHGGPERQSNGGENCEPQKLNTSLGEGYIPREPWPPEDPHLLLRIQGAPPMQSTQRNCP